MADLGLVVPIRLEALLVGARDAQQDDHFLPPYADFRTLPYRGGGIQEPYLSSLALNQPFTGSAPFPQGIHLHWNVPKALRRGVYDERGHLSVPSAPNRWLVTRILVSTGGLQPEVTLTSWVVESDYLSDDPNYSLTTVPRDPAGALTYAYLGRVYTLDDWLVDGEKGTYLDGLTAMGFGVPDFASYYPNCRNVFGLLDTTLNDGYDPTTTSLAYTVTGWYAHPAQDPLHGTSIGGASNALGWLFAGSGTPTYSLYTGAVWAVGWNPPIAFFPDYGTPINPDVALGNTPEEAVSALIARQLRDQGLQDVEQILNALQLGVLHSLNAPDGLATLEEAGFNAEFGPTATGVVWDVRPVPGVGGLPADASCEPSVSSEVAQGLGQLNDLQHQIDALKREAVGLQGQILADWQKFMTVLYADNPGQYPSVDRIYDFVVAEITVLDGILGEDGSLAMLQARADSLRDSITAALPARVKLTSSPAPRFYRANDPVILLSGDGVPASPPDNGPTVRCVLTDAFVTSMTLPTGLVGGSEEVTLDASQLPAVPGALPYPAVALLVQQAQLLNPTTSSMLAAFIAGMGGGANPALTDFTATCKAIQAAQTEFLAGTPPSTGITFAGVPPQVSVALKTWAMPWNPIGLSWRFDWHVPQALADGEYSATFVTDNFTWNADALDWRLDRQSFSSTVQQYSGSVLLSPDASMSIRGEIQQYLEHYPDGTDNDELRQILADLSGLPLLAQALGGLSEAMLMLEPTMQLPIADPVATDPIYSFFSNTTVRDAVGRQTMSSPVPSSTYSPLRAGRAVLEAVFLIDEFGRYKTVDVERPIISRTLPNDGQHPPALFPPLRLAQAARLDFRWLSAADPAREATSIPALTPICGWVVPNHLAGSLMFYDTDGTAIGSLASAGDDEPLVWQPAPGDGPAKQTVEEAFQKANAVLAAFAHSVVTNGPRYLPALVRTFDESQTLIGPAGYTQDAATAVLIGAPLAIVQASIGLTLQGLPSPDQGWTALQNDIDHGDAFSRTTRGFPGVKFPVWLGNLATLGDGLVGFFTTALNGEVDFGTFWTAKADGSDPHITAPTAETLAVSAAPDARPQVVTLLVDPRGSVHAMTGITPVKVLDIPAHVYAAGLNAMTFTFLASPVLALPGGFAVPIPAEGDGTWSWMQYAQGAWTETAIAAVNLKATLQTPERVAEGWLKLTPKPGTTR